jgi:DNA repair exonuclease SbcCD nuclease subunit
MLRLLHTADVHLGARHEDLGDQAVAQRERQFAAFVASIDLALAERVDLFLVAGDLFDSNVQPRRSVERAGSQLRRLVESRIRTVLIPGTHDVYDRGSIYRAYDMAAMSGAIGTDLVTVLDPDHTDVHLAALDVVVRGRCFATKRAPESPLAGYDASTDTRATWHVGLLHAALAIPDKTDGDDVVITADEIAASHLDYLALGHWHSTVQGKSGDTVYAYSGAPEAVAMNQDGAGKILLVSLEEKDGKRQVTIDERQVGKTRFEKLELDAATIGSQPALVETIGARADPDIVLEVQLFGVRPDSLDLSTDEVENELGERFLKLRIRDRSIAPLADESTALPDTVLGAFIRDMEAQIAEAEAGMLETGDDADGSGGPPVSERGAELRDALRLGRLLLAGEEVTL